MRHVSYEGMRDVTTEKPGRRRGAVLEEAILDATWSELQERGYATLTLESVAERAGTSRPVISRRWPSRAALATSALARHVARNPISVPDLGSVRDELRLLLTQLSKRAKPELIRVVFDMQAELAHQQVSLADMKRQILEGSTEGNTLRPILDRAITRGEIDAARLTPRIASLPGDLARHEMLLTLAPLSDQAIREIVDDIFMPLVVARDLR